MYPGYIILYIAVLEGCLYPLSRLYHPVYSIAVLEGYMYPGYNILDITVLDGCMYQGCSS